MKFLQNSNESNTEKDEISVEGEKKLIKRSTISFISAGVACSILSFGAFSYTNTSKADKNIFSDNIPDDAIAIQISEEAPSNTNNDQSKTNIVKTDTKAIVTEANSSSVSIVSPNDQESPQPNPEENNVESEQCENPDCENPDSLSPEPDLNQKPTQASSPNEDLLTAPKEPNLQNHTNNNDVHSNFDLFSPDDARSIAEQKFPLNRIGDLVPSVE